MKIDPQKLTESPGLKRDTQNIQKSPAMEVKDNVAKAGATVPPADKVEISSKSKQISDIMAAVNQLPDVREARVQEIKKSVEAGTYTIDPMKVAENILKEI